MADRSHPSTATNREVVTRDPFLTIAKPTPFEKTPSSPGSAATDTRPAYGSIPLIRNDRASIKYLLDELVAGAQKAAFSQGLARRATMELESRYYNYARGLAKTLSHLTREQQNLIFYGIK